MTREGGYGIFMDWNARQSYRRKIVTTVILGMLMIGEHWLFIGIRIEIHGALILVGMMGIGFHLWFLSALMNTILHDGRTHRRVISQRYDRLAYHEYISECYNRMEQPMTEEEWAKKHKIRTMQV